MLTLGQLKMPGSRGAQGFTLIELMISMILLAILVTFAVPSFVSFRERSVVRGAAEQLIAAVATARMEAVKRDNNVSVTMLESAGAWCAGVIEVPAADADGDLACDCFETDSSEAVYCDLGTFPPLDDASADTPEEQAIAGMRGARLLAAPEFDGDGTFSFDPKLGLLVNVDDIDSLVVRSPSDEYDFRLRFDLGVTGRATLCVPTGGRAVAGYRNC